MSESISHSKDSRQIITRKIRCRLCSSLDLKDVLNLSSTPLANDFVDSTRLDEEQPVFPLELSYCNNCYHTQLKDVVDPKLLYENYIYVSGTSKTFVRHFEEYANYAIREFDLDNEAFIVDIGSNDGTLLKSFQEHGLTVLGVDPAKNISEDANKNGIPTLNRFFDNEVSNQIQFQYGKADLVVANNVFAHIDDLDATTIAIENLLTKEGVFIFEVSYLKDVVSKNLFDTIYHEHLSYHSLTPLISFFRKFGMEVIDAINVPAHGGSIRVSVKKKNGTHEIRKSVNTIIANEQSSGMKHSRFVESLGSKISDVKSNLSNILNKADKKGLTISGYGAPAKATTLLYELDLHHHISYIVDDSPLKQGTYTPGAHIPVVGSNVMKVDPTDYMVILAWNFAEPIMANNKMYRENGGSFIVPLPDLLVYS